MHAELAEDTLDLCPDRVVFASEFDSDFFDRQGCADQQVVHDTLFGGQTIAITGRVIVHENPSVVGYAQTISPNSNFVDINCAIYITTTTLEVTWISKTEPMGGAALVSRCETWCVGGGRSWGFELELPESCRLARVLMWGRCAHRRLVRCQRHVSDTSWLVRLHAGKVSKEKLQHVG